MEFLKLWTVFRLRTSPLYQGFTVTKNFWKAQLKGIFGGEFWGYYFLKFRRRESQSLDQNLYWISFNPILHGLFPISFKSCNSACQICPSTFWASTGPEIHMSSHNEEKNLTGSLPKQARRSIYGHADWSAPSFESNS